MKLILTLIALSISLSTFAQKDTISVEKFGSRTDYTLKIFFTGVSAKTLFTNLAENPKNKLSTAFGVEMVESKGITCDRYVPVHSTELIHRCFIYSDGSKIDNDSKI
ncbi:MAG TPA: hypothetical protein VNJ01_13400 [Bacteriovoracaceae bacterium]|nr:hypothetical protein [Bacteriovoracaceae bacterium]